MGRTPFCNGLFESPEDRLAVEQAMAQTDSQAFAARPFRELSGGERQRVALASALAQQPEALLLDEPTTFLDLKHQIHLYRLMRDLAREGRMVVAITHDLNLAAAYADRVIALADGKVAADGPPAEVVTEALVRRVFDAAVTLRQGDGGRPWVSYG
ncbi:MAG: ABC transporter ATP-binding protein [Bryobacterales bacterium]